VQFGLLRSCGNGKLPFEFAGVGVDSQLSPPPELPPSVAAPLLPPLLEPLLLPLLPPLLDPVLDPLLPPLLEPLLAPEEPLEPLPLPLELPLASGLFGPPSGVPEVEVAQAVTPRNPTRTDASVKVDLCTGPPSSLSCRQEQAEASLVVGSP
jgi:hypothetical protein